MLLIASKLLERVFAASDIHTPCSYSVLAHTQQRESLLLTPRPRQGMVRFNLMRESAERTLDEGRMARGVAESGQHILQDEAPSALSFGFHRAAGLATLLAFHAARTAT